MTVHYRGTLLRNVIRTVLGYFEKYFLFICIDSYGRFMGL